MKEEWKPVKGYEGYYEVSNEGRMRSVDRYVAHPRSKTGYCFRKGRIRVTSLSQSGRRITTLKKGGNQQTYYVHRLVMQAFIGDCPEGKEVCHNDGNPQNNNLNNLRYGTKKENSADRLLHGTDSRGSKSVLTTLSECDVRDIKWALSFSFTHKEIGEYFGVSHFCITNINRGHTWAHIN